MSLRIKLIFVPLHNIDCEGLIYYQLCKGRTVKSITSGIRIQSCEWDDVSKSIKLSDCNKVRKQNLFWLNKTLKWDTNRILQVAKSTMDISRLDSLNKIIDEYNRLSHEGSFSRFICELSRHYIDLGQVSTGDGYLSAHNSFMRFTENHDVPLDGIDSSLIQHYESWLLHVANVQHNTSSFYMRKLRSAYNIAVEMGLTPQRNPFRKVYTGKAKTAKRAISVETIRLLKRLDLKESPNEELARDLFLFSFYTRGMSFIDMAYLKEENIHDGYITYRRHKTGQTLSIKWESCMEEIVNKHNSKSDKYLLPIITSNNDSRGEYKRMQYKINYALRCLSGKNNIKPSITMYVARHSWASIAKSHNIPIQVISEGMGHDSERTTLIYLSSINASEVDKANFKILQAI